MVKVTKTDGTELGYTDEPIYIKLAKNGCYVICEESKATGIVFDGVPYHMFDRAPLKDGCEDVAVNPIDGGPISYNHGISINELENAICENDAIYAEEMANMENAMCDEDAGKENV